MKMNSLLAGSVFALLIFITISCNKEDDKPYTSYAGSPGRVGYCSVVASDGNIYLTGTSGTDVLVMKTDLKGKLIWEKTFNLFGHSVSNHGWTIEETFDHGFLISAYDSWDTYYNGLLKINSAGDSLWSIILQDSGHVALQAIVEASDHNIIVVHEEEVDYYQDLHSITISKISPDGILIERKPYPEFLTPEIWIDGWQASQDGSVMIALSRYNQAASVWTINSFLDVTSQESFQDGKEIAYFTESPGEFICGDQIYDHSTHLYINKARPENEPVWEQDIPMPCQGWVYHEWIGSVTSGYIVLGTLWDMGHSTYYPTRSFCLSLDETGAQKWLWYDDISIYGSPYNFHSITEDEYLIIGHPRGGDHFIVFWRLKNGNVIN